MADSPLTEIIEDTLEAVTLTAGSGITSAASKVVVVIEADSTSTDGGQIRSSGPSVA